MKKSLCAVLATAAVLVAGASSAAVVDVGTPGQLRDIGSKVDRLMQPNRVAMFILPLNLSTSEHYTCIELKASTNNFAKGSENPLVFYCHTAVDIPGRDVARVFAESHFDAAYDQRSYVPVGPGMDEAELDTLPRTPALALFVDVGCCRSTDGGWLSDDNEEVVWTYARGTEDSREEDGSRTDGGRRALWRPCAPVRWFSRMPAWATPGAGL